MFYFTFASTFCQTPAYLILFFNWKVEKMVGHGFPFYYVDAILIWYTLKDCSDVDLVNSDW